MKVIKQLFLLIFILIYFLPNVLAQEEAPLNIGLTRFEAIPLENGIRVEWDTDTELGTVGFMLKKGQNNSFSYISNPEGDGDLFIDNVGGPDQGYNYSFLDESVTVGEVYAYQLVEITADGQQTVQAETSTKAGVEPTQTPIAIPGNGGGDTVETTQVTATPTITIQATSTPEVQNTPQPTPTLLPTNPPPTITASLDAGNPKVANEPADNSLESPAGNSENDSKPVNETDSMVIIEEAVDDFDDDGFGIAVAQAQEETSEQDQSPYPYPGSNPDQTDSNQAQDSRANSQPVELTDDPIDGELEQPLVIGGTGIQNMQQQTNPASLQSQTGEIPPEGMLGRVYLWVGLLAALVIFTAAVIGAIILYTRRRLSGKALHEDKTP